MPNEKPENRPPIDSQELAAFIDGRLDEPRRRQMVERLAEDDDAYELFSEIVGVREELAARDSAAPPLEVATSSSTEEDSTSVGHLEPLSTDSDHPSRRVWLWAAAAAAVLCVGLLGWLSLVRTAPLLSSEELLSAYREDLLRPETAELALEQLGPLLRGPSQRRADERATRFKLGVRGFDLALAARSGSRVDAAKWAGEMSELLAWGIPVSSGEQDAYREIERLTAEGHATELDDRIAALEADLEILLDSPPEPPMFAFGRWVEGLRVAAATGDSRILSACDPGPALSHFRRHHPSRFVAGELASIESLLPDATEPETLASVEGSLERILDHCGAGRPCLGGDATR